MIKQENKTKH